MKCTTRFILSQSVHYPLSLPRVSVRVGGVCVCICVFFSNSDGYQKFALSIFYLFISSLLSFFARMAFLTFLCPKMTPFLTLQKSWSSTQSRIFLRSIDGKKNQRVKVFHAKRIFFCSLFKKNTKLNFSGPGTRLSVEQKS